MLYVDKHQEDNWRKGKRIKSTEMDYRTFEKNNSLACSVTGMRNKERDAECEDIIYINETTRIKFYGLADGQSGKKYCRDGGREVLDAIFRYVVCKGISQMIQYEHVDELRYELIRVARSKIAEMALIGEEEKTEYASTIVVFAYDSQTDDYVLIHLGDGGILGQKKDGEVIMLSSPENGLTTNYTWLTTSQEALNHLRIGFGKINGYKRVLMITDGATVLVRGKNISDRALKYIDGQRREDIVNYLCESNPTDDASCIIIDFYDC